MLPHPRGFNLPSPGPQQHHRHRNLHQSLRTSCLRCTLSPLAPDSRRFERLYPLFHNLVNWLVGFPKHNPRRLEQPGDEVIEKVWKYEGNGNKPRRDMQDKAPKVSYHDVKRIAGPGKFGGNRMLLVLNQEARVGEKNWRKVKLPLPPG